MKSQNLLVPLAVLAANSAFAAAPLRGDCEARIRAAVAAASTDVQTIDEAINLKLDQKSLDDVVIGKVISRGEGRDIHAYTIYTAQIASQTAGLKGTVKVTATRGGCFLRNLNLHQ
jgi:hypothetical protein